MRRKPSSAALRGRVSESHQRLRLVEPSEEPEVDTPLDLDAAFRRYAPYVARIAARLLGDAQQIDDVVQDVFLDAHRGLHSMHTPAALKGWLATVTVRKVRRRLRRQKVARFIGLDKVAMRDELIASDSPEVSATLSAVYRVLEEMPVNDRIAWVLRRVEGHKWEEVAAACGCSRATAVRRVERASAVLKGAFDDT